MYGNHPLIKRLIQSEQHAKELKFSIKYHNHRIDLHFYSGSNMFSFLENQASLITHISLT